jgi:hypothetical protein
MVGIEKSCGSVVEYFKTEGMKQMSNSEQQVRVVNKDKEHDIVYALRTAQQHQVQLSLMADQKANILIGFSLIFFSILHASLFKEDIVDKFYFIPLIVLSLMFCLSFFMAVLVLMPRVKIQKIEKPEDMPNPLFFGFFSMFTQEEYIKYMTEYVSNNDVARELIMKDIYQIGVVLKRKYKLLRNSYGFITIGVVLTICIIVVQFITR